jgi:hypothetical protein
MAEPCPLATLGKCLPENVGQKADEDVSQHAVFFLMPDWAQPQIALVDAERRLGLGQLDLGPPEVFVVLTCGALRASRTQIRLMLVGRSPARPATLPFPEGHRWPAGGPQR